ncbi:hypothetical protein [Nostoc sp. UHCC 0870]|uniref:hypothetical protein n=1 Tax=Nostoc sp. UHCC 0870 TaxID=2914041 RepID=UPI001EDD420A|nr:hypothetical protein [Nostoc sp. UHCC 0870]UKP00949.1 hypothetical protein L6494_27730 [Nostoc sp. UHCC 0870]
MNFINKALNLADTLREKVQEAANGVENVVDGIKNTTVEITTSSINAVNDLPKKMGLKPRPFRATLMML